MFVEDRTICTGRNVNRFADALLNNPLLRLLSSLTYESVVSNNCFSIDNRTEQGETISSPFVTAIAGLILRKIADHPIIQNYLTEVEYHLIRCIRTDCVINFFHDSECNHDLDTFSCVNLFLFSENRAWLDRNMLIYTISKNKCHVSGGYKTWFDREDNNIDFFVNLNAYVLLRQLSYEDTSLCNFLKSHIDEFLSKGSHYYRNIEFPLFLIFFYRRHQLIKSTDEVFSKIISRILQNPSCRGIIDNMFGFYRRKDCFNGREQKRYEFPQYFNSTTKSFHSLILNTIINAYLFCQNENSYCENNPYI